MKKIIVLFTLLSMMTAPVFAQSGMVNYKKVLSNYTKAQKVVSEIDDKTAELQRYLLDQEKEYKKITNTIQRKAFEDKTARAVKDKQEALMKYKFKKEEEIDNDIIKAIKEVALKEGLEDVMDSQIMYFGGIDITDKVIKKLNLKQ